MVLTRRQYPTRGGTASRTKLRVLTPGSQQQSEIKQLFNDEYAEELKRFETTVEEMREELTAQIHDEMTDEQRELLNIK